jgi:4-amino-4-deoxy-L-arabinose transferase-like glycosyltransferase
MVLGLALRLVPWLAAYPLHRDEALYGTWARLIASGRDPLLLTPWVDKPPFVPYLLAGSLHLFGVSSLALRLPSHAQRTLCSQVPSVTQSTGASVKK